MIETYENDFGSLEIEDKKGFGDQLKKFDVNSFLNTNKIPLLILITGVALIGIGVFLYKSDVLGGSTKMEVLNDTTEGQTPDNEIVVEVGGAVEKPGVYTFKKGSRVEDIFIVAGGLSTDADRNWVDKYVNRAAKLQDGQKFFIPTVREQSDVLSAKETGDYQNISDNQGSGLQDLININSASLQELDTLPGIGPVYGQSIVEHRPYSNIEELSTKGVLKKSVYDKIKNLVTIY